METVQECFGQAGTCLTVFSFIPPVFPFLIALKGKLNFEDTPVDFITTSDENYFRWHLHGDMTFSDQTKHAHTTGQIKIKWTYHFKQINLLYYLKGQINIIIKLMNKIKNIKFFIYEKKSNLKIMIFIINIK